MWGIKQKIIQPSKNRKECEIRGSSLWVKKVDEIFYLLDRECRDRGRDFIYLCSTGAFD